MWRGLQCAVHFNLKVENWHRSPLDFSAAIVQWCVVTVQCGAGPGGEALVHKSQTVRPRDEWSNTNCRICAHKYQMGTNPRWEAARNTNCRWKKSQLQMGEIRGEMQEIRRGRVRMQIARGFPRHHRTFSIFLAVVDEDWTSWNCPQLQRLYAKPTIIQMSTWKFLVNFGKEGISLHSWLKL